MSKKERIRLEAVGRVKRGELTLVQAAEVMHLSVRQARARFRAKGDGGLVHGLRGQPSNHRLDQAVRDRIVKLHQERYADFGPTLACEKLGEEGLVVSPNTLSGLLKERQLWVRRRRRGRHRSRRDRRACFGSLVQMDGSHHDWFEGRSDKCVLMVMIDDATSRTYARFYPQETTEAAFEIFGRWVAAHGLPCGLYVDRDSIYRNPDHPEVPTQFARAMKELEVELILAGSPQAKGRVERRNAVFQDRLVKELRLRGISEMRGANDLLESRFLADLNRRFSIAAAKSADLHRPVPAAVVLEQVLCEQVGRTVGRDWCVRCRNRWLQIDRRHASLNLPNQAVVVKHLASGELLVEHEGKALVVTELAARPAPVKPKKAIVNNRRYKPSADHPWNQHPAGRAGEAAAAGGARE